MRCDGCYRIDVFLNRAVLCCLLVCIECHVLNNMVLPSLYSPSWCSLNNVHMSER